MTVARMRELRDEYFSGRRDKWSYVAETFRHHEQLFEYARWLPETGLADIRIEHGRVLVTVRASGLRFVLPEGDARSAPLDVLNFGAYETAELSTLVSLLEAPAVVVDVEANIGWYSMHLAHAFPEATIHAVEPGERTAAVLEENIAENGIRNVEVHRVALADKPGRALLHIPADLAVNASLRPVSPDRTTQLQPCAVKTLDELSVTLDGRIDCVKCDVEGGELDVFRGGARVLGEDRPVVFTEMFRKWSAAYGHHPNDVIALFSSMSYDCYAFDHQRLRRCTHVTEETTATNYVFLHRERHRAHIAAVA